MNEYTICLGSNCDAKSHYLSEGAEKLSTLGTILSRSGAFLSEPEFSAPGPLYLNEVVVFTSDYAPAELHRLIKAYESSRREAYGGAGVCIDIDIVIANGECLRPADASAHYFRTGIDRLKTG